MNEFNISDENRTIRQYSSGEVQFSVEDDEMVEIEYCHTNDFMYLRTKSYFSGKIEHCNSVDALIKRLTLPSTVKVSKRSHNSKEHSASGVCNADISTSRTLTTHSNGNENHATNTHSAFCVDPETGEVLDLKGVIDGDNDGERCRSIAGLRRTYLSQRKKVESTAKPSLSVFVTVTLDCYPTYDEMSEVVAKYALQVQRKFGTFKAGFIFLEPCEDGSWHAHLIVCFTHNIPADFEKECKKWWVKRNRKPCNEQVDIQNIPTFDDLERILDYLDPTSDKKDSTKEKTTKCERIRFYPLSSQPMRSFGNVVDSIKVLVPKKVADEIVKEEYDNGHRRKRTEIIETNTGELLWWSEEFVFLCKFPKQNYFVCKDGDCATCYRRDECSKYGKCKNCFAEYTSFCRGCIYDAT